MPHRHIDLDLAPCLSVAWRGRDVDLQLVCPSLFCDTLGPPQVFLQASQGGMVANKDVQPQCASPEPCRDETLLLSVTIDWKTSRILH